MKIEYGELLHARGLSKLIDRRKTYIFRELLRLLQLAVNIVNADEEEKENAIGELEEFLR